jgi:hypothetical protein
MLAAVNVEYTHNMNLASFYFCFHSPLRTDNNGAGATDCYAKRHTKIEQTKIEQDQ